MIMRWKRGLLAAAGISALALSIPVLGQKAPESLLPPGFGDPAPTPKPAAKPAAKPATTTPPQNPSPPAAPPTSGATPAPGPVEARLPPTIAPADDALLPDLSLIPPSAPSALPIVDSLSELEDQLHMQDYLPTSARRSLSEIGLLTPATGGLGADAFGAEGGQYLTSLIRGLNRPIISRWAAILLRRTLLTRLNSPANVNPADWVAERAWRLLLLGEADAARALTAKVDGGNYTQRLYEVTMQAQLATGDPAGLCPFAYGGNRTDPSPTWTMAKPICASFSGEQSTASSLLNQARRKRVATGIDYLLAEKTVGAGFDGRRAVTIKWDEVTSLNNWRFGLGLATGVEPPDRLYDTAGRQVQAWRARAPMLPLASRIKGAEFAAAMGVLSNRAMVDLYSAGYDDPDLPEDLKARTTTLRAAYISATAAERIKAMRKLWTGSDSPFAAYSAQILTARAAARIPAGTEGARDASDELIASMLTAGLDRSAIRWSNEVASGSLGWALLAVASPALRERISYGSLDDFAGNDSSDQQLKSKFLIAALAGLGRVETSAIAEFTGDLEIDLGRSSKWTVAIDRAAQRGQKGTVALLAAVGMQGNSWKAMSPLHLFHVTQALMRVGLEAEARMIAAEAITRA